MRFVFCVLLIATPLSAQQFSITAGGYLGDFGTQLRVDPHIEGLQGTTIDLEKDLGLQSTRTLSRFALDWQPFRKHELEVSYVRTKRAADRVINRQIVYKDTTFPVQAHVRSEFNIDFWQATYTYWLHQSDRTGFGFNLGVTGMKLNGKLQARNASTEAVLFDETASTNFPVPEIGLDGRFQIANKLIVAARASVLPRVSITDYEGEAYVGKFSIEYRVVPRIGIGIGYNYLNINGTAEQPEFHADVDMTVSGVEGFVRFVFVAR